MTNDYQKQAYRPGLPKTFSCLFSANSRITPLQAAADCVLTRLLAGDISLPGKPAGWVAGIIYAVANQGRRPCGIPGVLNQECEDFFHISIGTVYRRAAKIRLLLAG